MCISNSILEERRKEKKKNLDSSSSGNAKNSGDFTNVDKTNKAAQGALQSETTGQSIGTKTGSYFHSHSITFSFI